jgi:ubiquitin C-terminal hydrolase
VIPILEDLPEEVRKTDVKVLQVGLKNFGSTCYMNAMIQILNAVKPFRNLLMKA